MNPAHDTKNPPGCHYEKPLANQIDDYVAEVKLKIYNQGYKDGFEAGKKAALAIPEALTNSEYAR
jgi:hypothetical protein